MDFKPLTKDNSLNELNRTRINTYIDNAIECNKILYLFAPIAWGKTITLKNYVTNCKDKIEWK